MTGSAVRDRLRALVRRHGDQLRAASAMRVSPQYISNVLRGQAPGPKILRALGLRRVVDYVETRKAER